LGSRFHAIARWCGGKDAKVKREGRSFSLGFPARVPERPEGPRKQEARLRTNTPEGMEYGFPSGGKPLERREKAERFSQEAQERRDVFERVR
jgi:hypothetical protein